MLNFSESIVFGIKWRLIRPIFSFFLTFLAFKILCGVQCNADAFAHIKSIFIFEIIWLEVIFRLIAFLWHLSIPRNQLRFYSLVNVLPATQSFTKGLYNILFFLQYFLIVWNMLLVQSQLLLKSSSTIMMLNPRSSHCVFTYVAFETDFRALIMQMVS